jgi:F0F1-type ATP synthase assembly protein I
MSDKPATSGAKQSDASMWKALSLVGEIGYLIAIPAVVFGFTGGYLDKHYGTSPILVLVGLLLALLLSGYAVYRRVKAVVSSL